MKQLILTLSLVLTTAWVGAQNYIVVNSEQIFKSQADYNEALTTLDNLAQEEQKKVDEKFAEVETLYNRYMRVKSSLSPAQQQAQEEAILSLEQSAQTYQQSVFGNEGSLMKKRVELIQPIQKRIFTAIETYAKRVGADLVLDSAQNPTLLYQSESVDKTQAIIDALK